MNKEKLAEEVSEKLNLTKKEVLRVIDAIFSAITETLKQGQKVNIAGFGAFFSKVRKSRQGVNPRTGERITIPEMKIPKFQAGKTLKEALK